MRLPSRRMLRGLLDLAMFALIVVIVELLILAGLVLAGSYGLLNPSEIVSLVIAEVPIGVFFWLIFGERRQTTIREAVDRLEIATKFVHLQIHSFPFIPHTHTTFNYVENISKKKAYDAPRYLLKLGHWEYIKRVDHKNEQEMLDYFRRNNIEFVDRDPLPDELLA